MVWPWLYKTTGFGSSDPSNPKTWFNPMTPPAEDSIGPFPRWAWCGLFCCGYFVSCSTWPDPWPLCHWSPPGNLSALPWLDQIGGGVPPAEFGLVPVFLPAGFGHNFPGRGCVRPYSPLPKGRHCAGRENVGFLRGNKGPEWRKKIKCRLKT